MKKVLNYMKGELEQMPKEKVADILIDLNKSLNKKVLKTKVLQMPKNKIIEAYIKLRNKAIIFG